MPSVERGPDAADAEPEALEVLTLRRSRRPSAARGEEEEPGSLLVSVAQWTTVPVGACHPATLDTPAARYVSQTSGTRPRRLV